MESCKFFIFQYSYNDVDNLSGKGLKLKCYAADNNLKLLNDDYPVESVDAPGKI